MTLSVVPCFSDPSWSMSVTLEGVLYNFQFDWNERGACWYLSLADVDGVGREGWGEELLEREEDVQAVEYRPAPRL